MLKIQEHLKINLVLYLQDKYRSLFAKSKLPLTVYPSVVARFSTGISYQFSLKCEYLTYLSPIALTIRRHMNLNINKQFISAQLF